MLLVEPTHIHSHSLTQTRPCHPQNLPLVCGLSGMLLRAACNTSLNSELVIFVDKSRQFSRKKEN